MNEYNIGQILAEMELELVKSLADEMKKGSWQVNKLQALKDYQKRNKDILKKYKVTKEVKEAIKQAYSDGGNRVKEELKAVQKREDFGSFFGFDDKKLKALTKAVSSDFQKSEYAVLRMMDDQYRKTIFGVEVELASGNLTLNKAIDKVTKNFLEQGINCIQYKDGRRVNIASWAEMALRTANRRANLQGAGAVRAEWGIHTVLISQYGACSPTCLPWQGKVYIDDVYSNGEKSSKYPLLSTAISNGLFHPNCRHTSSTFIEGINTPPQPMADTTEVSANEAVQRYNERQIRKYKRLEAGSTDDESKLKYGKKVREWQKRQREWISKHPELRRDYSREKTRGVINIDSTAKPIQPVVPKPEVKKKPVPKKTPVEKAKVLKPEPKTLKTQVDEVKTKVQKADRELKEINEKIRDLRLQMMDNEDTDMEYLNDDIRKELRKLRDKVPNLQAEKELFTKEAGKLVIDDIKAPRNKLKAEIDVIKDKIKDTKYYELEAEKNKLGSYVRGLRDPKDIGMSLTEIQSKRFEITEKMINLRKDVIDLELELKKAQKAYSGSFNSNRNGLKETLSKIRPTGINNDIIDAVSEHLTGDNMKDIVREAYDYYPTEWIEKSMKRSKLECLTVDRGYYSDWTNEIAISTYRGVDGSVQTAYHELGHRFERAVDGIKEAERLFYERRTQGEDLKWLGGGYDKDEKTRFDKFLEPYMGKDYGGQAYELVSMGFEWAYTDPTRLWEDPDMAEWIYGILATY